MASSRMRLAHLAWLLAAALATTSSVAEADPSPQQKELARDLMKKGRSARNARDLKLALESFRGADDIMHVPTTGFEVARSQVDLGMLVEAHETLLAVLRTPERPGEPQAFRDARGYAKLLDDDLAARIPQIRIKLQGPATGAAAGAPAIIAVDGVTLPEGALLVPYKLDPGHHVVTAKSEAAEGHAEADLAERQNTEVTLTLTPTAEAAPAPPAAAPSTANAAPTASDATSETLAPRDGSEGGGGPGAVAWTGFAVAAAGVALGTVTGILAFTGKGSIASQCNGTHCPPSTYDALSSADTLATVSSVAFAVAAAGASVGVASWLLGRHGPPAPAAARVTPVVGLGAAGLAGTF